MAKRHDPGAKHFRFPGGPTHTVPTRKVTKAENRSYDNWWNKPGYRGTNEPYVTPGYEGKNARGAKHCGAVGRSKVTGQASLCIREKGHTGHHTWVHEKVSSGYAAQTGGQLGAERWRTRKRDVTKSKERKYS